MSYTQAQRAFVMAEVRAILKHKQKYGIADRNDAVDQWTKYGYDRRFRTRYFGTHFYDTFLHELDWMTCAPENVFGVWLGPAGLVHDIRYALKCERKRADLALKHDVFWLMVQRVDRAIARAVAETYYAGVRTFGKYYW